ncbi:MAG: tRNA pseudouridine(38-40) synthase TruA [Bacteroidales bacterium]
MPRYFLHMAYDGSAYYGWQIQPDRPTVQQVMEEAISTLLREDVGITGAGRTDTGVHASCFVAHFDTRSPIDKLPEYPGLEQWVFKLNRFLPPDIVVYDAREVPEDWHARFSATYRTYHYHISTLKPLYNRDYTHYLYGKLDTGAIQRCCQVILETHDFTSFSKLHTDVKTNLCQVMEIDWVTLEDGYRFEIRADRFLRNMVRSIVGTLLEVGMGKLDEKGFREIIDARDRGRAGQSVPAKGLFLVDIGYGSKVFKGEGAP